MVAKKATPKKATPKKATPKKAAAPPGGPQPPGIPSSAAQVTVIHPTNNIRVPVSGFVVFGTPGLDTITATILQGASRYPGQYVGRSFMARFWKVAFGDLTKLAGFDRDAPFAVQIERAGQPIRLIHNLGVMKDEPLIAYAQRKTQSDEITIQHVLSGGTVEPDWVAFGVVTTGWTSGLLDGELQLQGEDPNPHSGTLVDTDLANRPDWYIEFSNVPSGGPYELKVFAVNHPTTVFSCKDNITVAEP